MNAEARTSKRAGLLGLLLVLALGSGVVGQEPSPEATPVSTLDDTSSLMPQQAGNTAASAVEPAIHWRTDRMDLQADGLKVQLGDLTFTPEGADVTLTEDVYRKGDWNLLANWTADGHDNNLRLNFRSNGTDWYVETIGWWVSDLFMPDGRPGLGDFGMGATNATRTRLGETFTGDLQKPTDGYLLPCSPNTSGERMGLNVTAYFNIEGLRLTVHPRERSPLEKALRFVGLDGLLDDPVDYLSCGDESG